METNQKNVMEKDFAERAKKRILEIKNFYIHLLIYIVGMIIYTLKEYFGLPFNFPPISYLNWFFIAIWTFVLFVKASKIFMKEIILGSEWEERKIQKMLEKKSIKQNWE